MQHSLSKFNCKFAVSYVHFVHHNYDDERSSHIYTKKVYLRTETKKKHSFHKPHVNERKRQSKSTRYLSEQTKMILQSKGKK